MANGNATSLPYGDLFDIMLSDAGAAHLAAYPVLMLAGGLADDMNEPLAQRLRDYVHEDGTLMINVEHLAGRFDETFLGGRVTEEGGRGEAARCNLARRNDVDGCNLDGRNAAGCTMSGLPFTFRIGHSTGAATLISSPEGAPLTTRNLVGRGAVLLTLVPHLLQESGSAVCFLPHLLEHLTSGLLPFRVAGDVAWGSQPHRRRLAPDADEPPRRLQAAHRTNHDRPAADPAGHDHARTRAARRDSLRHRLDGRSIAARRRAR
jgi:hypothetical protein